MTEEFSLNMFFPSAKYCISPIDVLVEVYRQLGCKIDYSSIEDTRSYINFKPNHRKNRRLHPQKESMKLSGQLKELTWKKHLL